MPGNQRPNRKQEAPGEGGLNISASFPECKAVRQGPRAALVLFLLSLRSSELLAPHAPPPHPPPHPNRILHLLEVEGGILKGPRWRPSTHTHAHLCKDIFWHGFLVQLGSLTEMTSHTSRLPAAAVVAVQGSDLTSCICVTLGEAGSV